jgi:hypothetical protein
MLPWWLPMVGSMHHSRPDADPPDHRIKHARTQPLGFLPREGYISCPGAMHKINLQRCR